MLSTNNGTLVKSLKSGSYFVHGPRGCVPSFSQQSDTTTRHLLPGCRMPSHPIWCSNDSTSTSKTNCREEILKNFSSLFYAIATPLYTFADNFLRFPASLVDADKLQQPLPPLARTGEEPSNWIKRPDIRHQTATAKVGEDSKTSIAWLLLLKNMKKNQTQWMLYEGLKDTILEE